MSNVPDEIRKAILDAAQFYGMMQHGKDYVTDADSDKIYDEYMMIKAWLDSQPAAPEPDWSEAPEWADAWVVETSCRSWWWAGYPVATNGGWSGGGWSGVGRREFCHHESLPLGIDWRTTLRKRPTAEELDNE